MSCINFCLTLLLYPSVALVNTTSSSPSYNPKTNPFSYKKHILLSEWLLFNTNSANFQLYHGEIKLIFNEMMMRSALYQINLLSWLFIGLAHWNNSPQIDMSPHLDILLLFLANQSLVFLLNAMCLCKKATNTNFIVFGLTRPDLVPTIYPTQDKHTNHYTINVVHHITDNIHLSKCH